MTTTIVYAEIYCISQMKKKMAGEITKERKSHSQKIYNRYGFGMET
jgi:hypothetical protein